MDLISAIPIAFDKSQMSLVPTGDWWSDLVETPEYFSWPMAIPTESQDLPIECTTHLYLDSPDSNFGYFGSPTSSTTTTNSSPTAFGYTVKMQQQPTATTVRDCNHVTRVKSERRRNQNRMAQRAYRDRKEQRLRELEDQLARCKGEYDQLLRSYQTQQKVKQTLDSEKSKLASCITCLEHNTTWKETLETPSQPIGVRANFLRRGNGEQGYE